MQFNVKEWVKDNLYSTNSNCLVSSKNLKRLSSKQEQMVCELSAEAGCRYAINVLGSRLPKKYEEKILKDKDWFIIYAIYVFKRTLPKEYESRLTDTKSIFLYSKFVLKNKPPENLHNFMMMKSFEHPDDTFIKGYLEFVSSIEKPA